MTSVCQHCGVRRPTKGMLRLTTDIKDFNEDTNKSEVMVFCSWACVVYYAEKKA